MGTKTIESGDGFILFAIGGALYSGQIEGCAGEEHDGVPCGKCILAVDSVVHIIDRANVDGVLTVTIGVQEDSAAQKAAHMQAMLAIAKAGGLAPGGNC